MSRAAWLALGSSAAAIAGLAPGVACVPSHESEMLTEAGKLTEASDDGDHGGTDADGSTEAAVTDASCSAATGGIPCGDASCDSRSEYCAHRVSQFCGATTDRADCRPLRDDPNILYPFFPVACVNCPTCTCVNANFPKFSPNQYVTQTWKCSEATDGGGVTVHLDEEGCGPCYGAPPARLERLGRPTHGA